MPRPKGLPKTGGRGKNVPNKPPMLKLPDTEENRALVLAAPTTPVLTPKAVMAEAMKRYYDMAHGFQRDNNQAEENKAWGACVAVAKELAPFVHARYLAVESRSEEKAAPFVVRAPAVMADSSAWQAAVGAAVIDMEAQNSPVVRSNEVPATPPAQTEQQAPQTAPVALMNDPKTNRITVMPPGPRVVQPSGTEQWLASIQKKVG
jgi:hypothetical protein